METEVEKEIIKKSYGEVFQSLREAKNISQKVAAGSAKLQGNLSRFEKGEHFPMADTFFKFLRNIKVFPFEFVNALDNYLTKKDILLYLDEVGKAYTSQDSPRLKQIIQELELQGVNDPKCDKFLLDRIMAESILSLIDSDFKIPHSDADKIRSYLRTTKYWGYYELRLLGCTSRLFDFFQLAEISNRVIYFATKNEISPHVKRQIILCELNILDSFLSQKKLEAVKNILQHLEEYGIPENFYYEKSGFIYLKAKYDYLTGNPEGLDIMKAHLSALKLYGCDGTAKICKAEIEELVNNPMFKRPLAL